jgi:hypothetical protein
MPWAARTAASIRNAHRTLRANPKARLTGNWAQLASYFDGLQARVNANLILANRDAAQLYEENLKKFWLGQRLGWEALSPEYLSQKISEGLDSRILIASGKAVGSLRQFVQSSKIIYVGVDARTDDANNFPYMLAHEFGIGVPQRGIIIPVAKALLPEFRGLYQTAIIRAFSHV